MDEGAVRSWAPGRVNLIGDHTDYTGGLVLPIAVDLGTEIVGVRGGDRLVLTSDADPATLDVDLAAATSRPAAVEPAWGRYVAAVAAELAVTGGLRGEVHSDLPLGAGLSSSAALEVAVALALGFEGDAAALATACQAAEHRATGVPTGIMDQLTIAAARAGAATLIDCHTLTVEHVPVPDSLQIVVRFVERRSLAALRLRRPRAPSAPPPNGRSVRSATPPWPTSTPSPTRRSAGGPGTSSARTNGCEPWRPRCAPATAPAPGRSWWTATARCATTTRCRPTRSTGQSTRSSGSPACSGARMTGGGFGGSVVVFAEPGAAVDGWSVRPADGALTRSGRD